METATNKELPRVAIKLSDEAQKKAKSDHNVIADLFEKVISGSSKNLKVAPLITSVGAEKLDELVKRAARLDPEYKPVDFSAWYQVQLDLDDGGEETPKLVKALSVKDPDRVDDLVRGLHKRPDVDSAFALREHAPPVNAGDDLPYGPLEGFLDAAPGGIDARYAWTHPGGDGAGVGFVDMEQGWDLTHPDLKDSNVTLISGANTQYHFHGTGVLGEVLMTDNQQGGIGIAPQCSGRVISQFQSGAYNTSAAIIGAIAVMQFGDVLLLEAQVLVNGSYAPVETETGTYDAIRLATALGIIVVEAAGNGGTDLDTFIGAGGKKTLNRSSKDFLDSGAILVGAGSSTSPHTRLGFSNFGSRIDCYGWGGGVATTYTDDPWLADNTKDPKIQGPETYTTTFSGTSSASPIVAGAAILVQGIAMNRSGVPNPLSRFGPFEMRRILSTNGTATANPATDLIGVMPNLKDIITGSILNLAPDIYVRDYVGDIGDKNTGILSASPDIIVRQTPVANPQALFGQGSGNEDNNSLSFDVLQGQANYVYVRMRNRGATDATAVTVTVYWSPPATLVSPTLWTPIGTATIPNVASGNGLTVSPAITWPSGAIPALGHYCFVAIAGSALDPAPNPATAFATFDQYDQFIANNNNIAWRNFNVTSAPPSTGLKDFHKFPFLIPGAFDGPRHFTIETLGALPRSSEVELTLPLTLTRQLKIHLQEEQIHGDTAIIPLPVFSKLRIGSGVLDKASQSQCEIKIRVPNDTYKKSGIFEFAIRQLLVGNDEKDEKELGRLTWRFGQITQVDQGHCHRGHCPDVCKGKCS